MAKTRVRMSLDSSSPQPKRRRRNHTTTDQSATASLLTLPTIPAGSTPDVTPGSVDNTVELAAYDTLTPIRRGRPRSLSPRKNAAGRSRSAATRRVTMPGDQTTAGGTDVAVSEVPVTKKRGRHRRALTADGAEMNSDGSLERLVTVINGVDQIQTADSAEIARVLPDTDEELPPFNRVSSAFSVGDLIWVKFRHYPFWPALVSCSFSIKLHICVTCCCSGRVSVSDREFDSRLGFERYQTRHPIPNTQ